MADFCNQCLDELGLPRGDLAGITSPEAWAEARAATVICEGCGFVQVDPAGNCVSADCLRKHGKPSDWVRQ